LPKEPRTTALQKTTEKLMSAINILSGIVGEVVNF